MNRTVVTSLLLTFLPVLTWANPDSVRWEQVEEILATRCVECHGPGEGKGGLRLHREADFRVDGPAGPP